MRARTFPIFLTAVAILLTAGALSAQRWSIGVNIGGPPIYAYAPPPPPVYYAPPPAPGYGYTWVGGYWYPGARGYVWTNGYWARPPYRGAIWIGPRWSGHRYYRGYWRR